MSDSKKKRQQMILDIIEKNKIETQEELALRLTDAGLNITQATISRDIREMKLTKVADTSGRLCYVAYQKKDDELEDKYIRIFKDGFVSMDNAQNMLVIRTVSGMAMAVAAALDMMHFPEVVGSIAGDDTIMCAIRTTQDAVKLMERLAKLIKNN